MKKKCMEKPICITVGMGNSRSTHTHTRPNNNHGKSNQTRYRKRDTEKGESQEMEMYRKRFSYLFTTSSNWTYLKWYNSTAERMPHFHPFGAKAFWRKNKNDSERQWQTDKLFSVLLPFGSLFLVLVGRFFHSIFVWLSCNLIVSSFFLFCFDWWATARVCMCAKHSHTVYLDWHSCMYSMNHDLSAFESFPWWRGERAKEKWET